MLATHIPHFVHPIRAVWLLLRRADIATSVRTRECLSGDHCFAHVPHVVALRAESEAKAGSKSRKQKQSQNSSSARLSSARGVHANALRTSLSIHGRVYPLAWASAATQWTLLLHATLSEFSNLPSFMYEWPPRRHRTQKQGYASSLHTPLLQCSPPNSQSHPARKQLMNTNRNRNRNYAPRMFGYSSNHSRCGVRTRWRGLSPRHPMLLRCTRVFN